MGGNGAEPQPAVHDRLANDRLDSWKEIAAYLKKEVRTVQRWEKSSGLPIRRLAHGKLGTVFAYKQELDAWWQESQSKLDVEENSLDEVADSSGSNLGALASAAGESEKARSDDDQPDGLRRLAVLILVLLGATILLRVFWRQIGDVVGFPRAKMVLAVRPFKNMSGDPNQDFVADGLTEEMITQLGQLHPDEMGVIRLSPAYASSGLDRIGKEVHANYVLEGGVRRSGQQVAITAQLIQVSDQTQVWGESYERDLQDVLRIQSEVAGAIAGGVLNKLPHAQGPTRQVNPEAYLAYLEGRYFWSKRTEGGFAKALTLFRRSIEIDPTYAGAADKAANLVGCKSPHHQLPGRVVSISDACGGNEACSART